MASKIDQLLSAFELAVNEPWPTTLSGQERIWFLVYDPSEQRKIDLRIEDFETATMKAGKQWSLIFKYFNACVDYFICLGNILWSSCTEEAN